MAQITAISKHQGYRNNIKKTAYKSDTIRLRQWAYWHLERGNAEMNSILLLLAITNKGD